MARMPGAAWRPVVNVHKNGVLERRGLVLHVQDDTSSPYGWFNNPASEASSDFWVRTDGHIEQYAETGTDYAWAQAAGNPYYASVETEGHPATALTAEQVEAVAQIYAWGHATWGWPLQVVDSTTAHGLTWHGVGGAAWGGHNGCPGDKRKAQRPAIIARAKQLAGGGAVPAGPSSSGVARYQVTINGLPYGYGAHGTQVTTIGQALVKRGFGRHYKSGPGPDWTDADTLNYADYQRSLGYTGADADGVPGQASLKRLLGTLPSASTPPAHPVVDLSNLIAAARTDPGAAQGHTTHPADVRPVEAALKAAGLLAAAYAGDGSFGSKTVTAYAAWQRRCGYTGAAADGIPGRASLARLGAAHNFTVTA